LLRNDRIGSKPLTQILFCRMTHASDYIAAKIASRARWSGVEDAAVTLAPAQIDALTTALLRSPTAQDMPRA